MEVRGVCYAGRGKREGVGRGGGRLRSEEQEL
jgi:hypothetical protein